MAGNHLVASMLTVLILGIVSMVSAQLNETLPYDATTTAPSISGTWEIVWTFNEMRGSVNTINPCRGPFPYQYRFIVDIMQDRNDPKGETLKVCYQSQDCTGLPWGYTTKLQQATLDAISSSCGFQQHSAPYADSDVTDGYSSSPLCQGGPCIIGRTTVQDILPNCNFNTPCPTDKLQPTKSRLFGNFQLPPNVWVKLCHQWDFKEPGAKGEGKWYVPHFRNAWRHMNETWAFVYDITKCPCYPGCSQCGKFAEGTAIFTVDANCMRALGLDAQACGYKIVGATGGAVIYPLSTTGLPEIQTDPPTPQTCWMYADISGTQTRTKAAMLRDHPEWQ